MKCKKCGREIDREQQNHVLIQETDEGYHAECLDPAEVRKKHFVMVSKPALLGIVGQELG